MNKALIFLAGDYLHDKSNLDVDYDIIIASDGGVENAMALGIVPDLVLGDLDSLTGAGEKYIKDNHMRVIKYPVEKDDSDSELALKFAKENGINYVDLVGAYGSRADHSLVNLLLLKKYRDMGIKIRILNEKNIIYFAVENDEIILPKLLEYASIVALSESGVTVDGKEFKYDLEERHISFGSSLGISNKVLSDTKLKVLSGECFIIQSCD